MTDRLIKLTTALVGMAVAGVAAIISYQHAYELERRIPQPASSSPRSNAAVRAYSGWPLSIASC